MVENSKLNTNPDATPKLNPGATRASKPLPTPMSKVPSNLAADLAANHLAQSTTKSASKTNLRISPCNINRFLFPIFIGMQLCALFILPHLILGHPILARLGLALVALSTLPLWYLNHEAIHGLFHSDYSWNTLAGRWMGVIAGVPFTGVRIAHLLHHRFNRVEEFAEVYDSRKTSWLAANIKHFASLFGGLYWIEFIGSLATWFPLRVRKFLSARLAGDDSYMKRFYEAINRDSSIRTLRLDSFAILVLYCLAIAFSPATALAELVAFLWARSFLISFFDNSFHYETGKNLASDARPARDHSFHWSWMILHFNYHGVHHRHPNLPWHELVNKAREERVVHTVGFFGGGLRQLKGAIPHERIEVAHVNPREKFESSEWMLS